MLRTRSDQLHSPRATRRNRRGVVTGFVLGAMIVMVGLIGLAWNVARMAHVHDQLRAACEAAALAGAAELMDDSLLTGAVDTNTLVTAARLEAQQFAATNVSFGQQVALGLNPGNDPRGDIVVGYVPLPTLIDCPMEIWQGSGPVNSVSVKYSNTAHRGNPITMYCGQFFGIPLGKVANTARATVDSRIYGFRPVAGILLPLVPLAADSQTWNQQAKAQAIAEVNDSFIVNYHDETVLPGSDGIPEFQLRAPLNSGGSGSSAASLFNLVLCPSNDCGDRGRQAQLFNGLGTVDLFDLGGEFALLGQLILPTAGGFDPSWAQAFTAIQGCKRIWPLGCAASGSTPGVEINGFGCAVVIAAQIDESGTSPQLVVTLQPALMATSAALASDAMSPNMWIAKLMLTE